VSGKHYIYILRCADDTLYTGWTTDVRKRVETHNSGKGAKYTRARLPVELVYTEEFDDKVEAQKREYAIKQLARTEKESLIESSVDEDIHDPCLRFQR
jgi:putative endonuclease